MVKKQSSQKMRILHVAFTLHDPMINQWLIRFLRKTKNADNQIDLMTTADEAALFQETIEQINGHLLICPHPKNKGAFLRFVRETLNNQDCPYDIVHVHPFIMAGEILMQAFRANIAARVMHAHADRRKVRRDKSIFQKIKHSMSKRLVQRLATHGVAPNNEVAKNIFGSDFGNDGRWKIMPYGLPISAFDKDQKEEGLALKQKLGLPDSSQIITQIAGFNFEKNHNLTLQVFEKEARRNLSLYLVLQGQGPLEEKIRQDVAASGLEDRVLFLDNKTDHVDVFKVMDLLILPSLYEYDISILIQSQLNGVPCLISNEIIQSDHLKNDLIYRLTLEGGVDIWAKAVRNILEDKKDYPSQIDQLKGSDFDIDTNAGKFLGLYNQLRNSTSPKT